MKAAFPSEAEALATSLSNCDLARRLLDSYKADGVQCQPGRALPSPPGNGTFARSFGNTYV